MFLDFAYPTRQQGFLFITVSCVAIALLLILWYFLNNYYKKTKLANAETKIEVIEPNLESEEPLVVEDIPNEIIEEEVVQEVELETVENSEELVEETISFPNELIETKKEIDLNASTETITLYKKSFLAKLILNKDLQPIYEEIRNYILSFKKVKSRLSFKYERFSIGRKVLAKMLVRGKRLYLYIALNPNDQLPKYHIVDVSDKKIGEQLPSLLKVLSPRSVKYAKELIDILMNENEIVQLPANKFISIDYKDLLRRRSLNKLIEEGLIVEYKVKANAFNFTQGGEFLTEEEIIAITPEKADELVKDSVLDEVVETKIEHRYGKIEVVNVDDLASHFNEGDYINLEALKNSHLVSKNACRIKVLARGALDKKISVEADAFSKQAMKMIIYKGGKVIVIN